MAADATASPAQSCLDVADVEEHEWESSTNLRSFTVVDHLQQAILLHQDEVSALRAELANLQRHLSLEGHDSITLKGAKNGWVGGGVCSLPVVHAPYDSSRSTCASSHSSCSRLSFPTTLPPLRKDHAGDLACSPQQPPVDKQQGDVTFCGPQATRTSENTNILSAGDQAQETYQRVFGQGDSQTPSSARSEVVQQSSRPLPRSRTDSLTQRAPDRGSGRHSSLDSSNVHERSVPSRSQSALLRKEPVLDSSPERFHTLAEKEEVCTATLTLAKVWRRDLIEEVRDPFKNPCLSRDTLGSSMFPHQGLGHRTKTLSDEAPGLGNTIAVYSRTPSDRRKSHKGHRLDRLVVAPTASGRTIWNFFCLVAITIDLVTVPLQVFEFAHWVVIEVLHYVFALFWTADLVINFFTGYNTRTGIIEMRVRKIAKNYIKGWFVLDLSVLSTDLLVAVADFSLSSMSLLRLVKFFRLVKSIRILRMTRLVSGDGLRADIAKYVNSEEFSTASVLVVRLLSILLCSHWIACLWYMQTLLGNGENHNWVKAQFPNDTPGVKYAAALHWTLTQFTPASMEVYPRNLRERIMSILVLVFGLITFTSLISSISNAMSHLQTLNSANFTRQQNLRVWLRENGVCMSLVARVWACVNFSSKTHRRTHQKDVELLAVLPSNIMTELYHEIFEPILYTHPFLGPYLALNGVTLRQICSSAISEMYFFAGEELFTAGDIATNAYFLREGVVVYDIDARKDVASVDVAAASSISKKTPLARSGTLLLAAAAKKKPIIDAGMWISEVALWVEWTYHAPALTSEYSEVIALSSSSFRDTLKSRVTWDHMLGKYASLFAQRAAHEHASLDVWFDTDVLEDLSWCAFQDGVDYSICLPALEEPVKIKKFSSSDSLQSGPFSGENENHGEAKVEDNNDEIRLPCASRTTLPAQRAAEAELKRWHARVEALREREFDQMPEYDAGGWKWGDVIPRIRTSLGEIDSGWKRRSKLSTLSSSSSRSRDSGLPSISASIKTLGSSKSFGSYKSNPSVRKKQEVPKVNSKGKICGLLPPV